MLANQMEEMLDRYQPDILLILTGINNVTLLGSNYYLFDPKTGPWLRRWFHVKSGIKSLRIFKLAMLARGPKNPPQAPAAPRPCKPSAQALLETAQSMYASRQFKPAEKAVLRAISDDGSCVSARYFLAYVRYKSGDYPAAFAEARGVLALEPRHRDAQWLLSKEMPLLHPRETAVILEKVLRYDLETIFAAAKRRGVKAVLQTYPHDSKDDTIREKAAADLHVPLIDHFSRFAPLMAAGEMDRYMAGDDPQGGHPNGAGYGLMAEEIVEALINEGVLPKKRRPAAPFEPRAS